MQKFVINLEKYERNVMQRGHRWRAMKNGSFPGKSGGICMAASWTTLFYFLDMSSFFFTFLQDRNKQRPFQCAFKQCFHRTKAKFSIEATGSCHWNTNILGILSYNVCSSKYQPHYYPYWAQLIVKTAWQEIQIAGREAKYHEGELCLRGRLDRKTTVSQIILLY